MGEAMIVKLRKWQGLGPVYLVNKHPLGVLQPAIYSQSSLELVITWS